MDDWLVREVYAFGLDVPELDARDSRIDSTWRKGWEPSGVEETHFFKFLISYPQVYPMLV